MPLSNVSELLKTYLDGDTNENPDILQAERKLLQIGISVVPALIEGLRERLREYRSYTMSSSDEKEFIKKMKEMTGDFSPGTFFDDMVRDRVQQLEKQGNNPGISPGQRLVSLGSIGRACKLVEKLGDNCNQLLCAYLKNHDMSLVMTSVAILFEIQDPSPYVVKSIVSSPYLYFDTPAQNRILFYLLISIIANSGDDYANEFVNADVKDLGTDKEKFSHYLMDMCIYFVSVSS